MSNSKHFYGQSRLKGGINIDESKLDPDDGYFFGFARGTLLQLDKIVGASSADELVSEFWNENHTWKEILEGVENVIADVRAKKAEQVEISNPVQLVHTPLDRNYDYHLQNGFTHDERVELHNWWNEKYKG